MGHATESQREHAGLACHRADGAGAVIHPHDAARDAQAHAHAFALGGELVTDIVSGPWQGKLAVHAKTNISIPFTFAKHPDGRYGAAVDSPDNPAIKNVPASAVSFSAGQLKLNVAALNGSCAGTLKDGKLNVAGLAYAEGRKAVEVTDLPTGMHATFPRAAAAGLGRSHGESDTFKAQTVSSLHPAIDVQMLDAGSELRSSGMRR